MSYTMHLMTWKNGVSHVTETFEGFGSPMGAMTYMAAEFEKREGYGSTDTVTCIDSDTQVEQWRIKIM